MFFTLSARGVENTLCNLLDKHDKYIRVEDMRHEKGRMHVRAYTHARTHARTHTHMHAHVHAHNLTSHKKGNTAFTDDVRAAKKLRFTSAAEQKQIDHEL